MISLVVSPPLDEDDAPLVSVPSLVVALWACVVSEYPFVVPSDDGGSEGVVSPVLISLVVSPPLDEDDAPLVSVPSLLVALWAGVVSEYSFVVPSDDGGS